MTGGVGLTDELAPAPYALWRTGRSLGADVRPGPEVSAY